MLCQTQKACGALPTITQKSYGAMPATTQKAYGAMPGAKFYIYLSDVVPNTESMCCNTSNNTESI